MWSCELCGSAGVITLATEILIVPHSRPGTGLELDGLSLCRAHALLKVESSPLGWSGLQTEADEKAASQGGIRLPVAGRPSLRSPKRRLAAAGG